MTHKDFISVTIHAIYVGMEDIRQQLDTDKIHEAVNDGSYYTRGKRWFDEVYHRPIAERTYFIVMMTLSIITIFFSAITYFSMFPLSRSLPYTIYSNDLAEELPIIKKLRAKPAEDINIAVGRYLLQNYVTERESYRYDELKLEWQFNRIRQTSAPEEFARYQEFRNPVNPASPFTKYGRTGKRSIQIYRLDMNLKQASQTASVYFTSTVNNGKTQQQNNWVANITFRFPELTVDSDTVDVLQFNSETNSYEVTEKIRFKVDTYVVREII